MLRCSSKNSHTYAVLGVGLLSATLLMCAAVLAGWSTPAFAQKSGGILKAMLRESWPSMSIHDESTISAVWPIMPMYSNLVLPDPLRQSESSDHLMGELAEKWQWSKDFKHLTFKLRHGVTWHDGKPFTSNDVKYTFDIVRGASDKRLKVNPRKDWYANVESITTNGDFEVTFNLKKPQPGLIAMLGSGYSPIYPAQVDLQSLRTKAVGTGPFMLAEVQPDESLTLQKNPHYFVKGRPYLDGIKYIVIKAREARTAAMIAGQLDIAFPGETTPQIRDQFKKDAPNLVLTEVSQSVNVNMLINTKKPPFDNVKLRRAVNLALDREALRKSVYQGALLLGGANLPAPYSEWGLTPAELAKLPGYGDPAKDKEEARKLLAEEGYGPNNPLKVVISTRAIALYVDPAVWAIDQLKQVGIDATLEQIETGPWHPKLTRREYQLAPNLTGVGSWDPDANYFENFSCGSPRNYTDYCTKEVQDLIDRESQETNHKKRLELVKEIDRKLQSDVARPILGHLIDFFAQSKKVKGLLPHFSIYNYGRMTDVWLDQ